jgi:hypothetical protein
MSEPVRGLKDKIFPETGHFQEKWTLGKQSGLANHICIADPELDDVHAEFTATDVKYSDPHIKLTVKNGSR